jgi:hypothetical protein
MARWRPRGPGFLFDAITAAPERLTERHDMRHGLGRLGLITALTCVTACTSQDTERTPFAVRDSAGVRIVEHRALPTRPALTLADAPTYAHGSRAGDFLFTLPTVGALQPDGRALVWDAGSRDLVHLAPSGELLAPPARRGRGPGEVGQVNSILAVGPDTLIIEDDMNGAFTTFAGGAVVSIASMGEIDVLRLSLGVVGRDSAGRLLLGTSGFNPRFEEPWLQGMMVVFDVSARRLDTVGTYDLVARLDASRPWNPFPAFGTLAAAGGRFVVGRTDRPELRWVRSDGSVAQAVRWPATPEPVTDDLLAAFLDAQRESLRRGNPGMAGAELERFLDEEAARYALPPGATRPLWLHLTGDAVGRVWLTEFTPTPLRAVPRYTVLAADGTWLGSVTMPDGFRLLDANAEAVLGVQRDEDDVEHIAVYRLVVSQP